MEGAVLFGIEPSTINVRKAKYTIGEGLSSIWNEKLHAGKGEKYFDEERKKWYCYNCFHKYIEINQNLKYGEEVSYISYIPSKSKNKKVSIHIFYKTKKQNPIFTFEEGITKIGQCRLDIGKEYNNYKDREIKTIMKFGGTYIDVTAFHIKTGKYVKTTLLFD